MDNKELNKKIINYYISNEYFNIAYDYLNDIIDDDIFEYFKNSIIIENTYLNQFEKSLTNKNNIKFQKICYYSAKNYILNITTSNNLINERTLITLISYLNIDYIKKLFSYFVLDKNIKFKINRKELLEQLLEAICYIITPNIQELEDFQKIADNENLKIPFIYKKFYNCNELIYIFNKINVADSFYFFQIYNFIEINNYLNKEVLNFIDYIVKNKNDAYLELLFFNFDTKQWGLDLHILNKKNDTILFKNFNKLLDIVKKNKNIKKETIIKLEYNLQKYINKSRLIS